MKIHSPSKVRDEALKSILQDVQFRNGRGFDKKNGRLGKTSRVPTTSEDAIICFKTWLGQPKKDPWDGFKQGFTTARHDLHVYRLVSTAPTM